MFKERPTLRASFYYGSAYSESVFRLRMAVHIISELLHIICGVVEKDKKKKKSW